MLPGRAKPIWPSRAVRAWWRRRSWVRSSAMWLILPRVCAVPGLTVYRLSESSFGRRNGDGGGIVARCAAGRGGDGAAGGAAGPLGAEAAGEVRLRPGDPGFAGVAAGL